MNKKQAEFKTSKRERGFLKEMITNRALYSMFLPAAVLLILFNYLPMFGLITAFKDFIQCS